MKVIDKIFQTVWPIVCMIMLVHVSAETAAHMDMTHFTWMFVWAFNCALYLPVIRTK